MRILVTGGAGYIGAHVVRLLRHRGDHVVICDDLSTGDAARVGSVPLHRIDLVDHGAGESVRTILADERIDAVVHFAARKRVDESVARPLWYYRQNVDSLRNVLWAMRAADVGRLVFSSSAAVYGATAGSAIVETDPVTPVNPYGETKLVGERLVRACVSAHGISAVSLRYFNVAGAGRPGLGDRTAANLVPMVFERIDAGAPPLIFGDDYDTPDGTCIRDYVHVLDVAEAHIAALDRADAGEYSVFNVGTGTGTSVREMVRMILAVARSELLPEVRARRPGDPASVVASPALISERLGWRARFDVADIVASAWEAHARQPGEQRRR